MSARKEPELQNGRWEYSEPSFDPLPPPNTEIICLSYPIGGEAVNGKLETVYRAIKLMTPITVTLEWFRYEIMQTLGWTFMLWRKSEDIQITEVKGF